MYSKKLFLILVTLGTLTWNSVALAQCTVDAGVAPELSKYIRDTTSTVQALSAGLSNSCGSPTTPVSSMNRVWSTLEKARTEGPIMNSIINDFLFNVTTVARFDASQKIINQGNLLYDLEKNVLIPTLDQLAAKCQLTGDVETTMLGILRYNNDLQDYYKEVAMGNIGVAPEGDALKAGILRTYRPENNTSCSDSGDMSSMIARLMKRTEGFGKDISIAMENWNEALRLIHGTSGAGLKKYQEQQAALLRQELGRQGLSQNAIRQMMTNLSCAQAEGNETLNAEEQSRALAKCERVYVIGYDKLRATLESLKWKARTSDEYLTLQTQSRITITQDTDILSVYAQLSNATLGENNAEVTTNKIITDLTNMHTSLVSINMLLERRIPKMQQNCRKGLPGIIGGCDVR